MSRIAGIAITAGSGWIHYDLDWRGKDIDWCDLDSRVCALEPPVAVIFAFQSRETMLEFAREVVDTMMPRASARELIKYAISGVNFLEWRKAFRHTDAMTEDGTLTSSRIDIRDSG